MLETCIITKALTATDIMEDLVSFPHHCFVTCKTIPHSFMLLCLGLENLGEVSHSRSLQNQLASRRGEDIKGNVQALRKCFS